MDCIKKLPSLQTVKSNLDSLLPIYLGHLWNSTVNAQDLLKVRHFLLFSPPCLANLSSACSM